MPDHIIPGNPAADAREAAARLLGASESPEPVGAATHLWHVRTADGEYALRRLAEGATLDAAALMANALKLAHAADPVFPEPVLNADGQSAVIVGGRVYAATSWLPGQSLVRFGDFRLPDGEVIDVPLPASAPAEQVLLQAASAIGTFHTAAAGLAAGHPAPASLSNLLAAAERTFEQQRRIVGRQAKAFPEIRRWLRAGNRVIPTTTELLRQAGDAGVRSVVVHGDVWPANLLVEGTGEQRRLTGIAGWTSVSTGSPLVDLAQLVTHGSGWSAARAEAVLGAYTESASLLPMERRLLPVVAALELLPRVGHMLHLAFVDDRLIGHDSQPVLRSGMKSLLSSLENLAYVLAPDHEWTQRKAGTSRQERGRDAARKPRAPRTTPARRPGSGRSRPR